MGVKALVAQGHMHLGPVPPGMSSENYRLDTALLPSLTHTFIPLHRSTAFDFPLKAQLQEACRNTQFDRLRDGQVRRA